MTESKDNHLISAKEISGKYNVTYQTINHYTNLGLLPLVCKKGNVRFYDRATVGRRLSMVSKLAGEGYSLRLIRKKLLGA